MSKELTEQWRNRAIQETYYYVKCPWSDGEVDIRYVHNGVDDWKEIIAPVPSYDEWQELQEASDGLSKIMFKSLMDRFVKADEERERLEQLLESETLAKQEGVEIVAELEYRLKEAENVIKFYADAQPLTEEERQMTAEKYHLVYGLKACDYLEKYKVWDKDVEIHY